MLPILIPLLAATLGTEFPLSGVRITNAAYTQTVSSVASNGRDFLALWSDQRNRLDPNASTRYTALYTGRIDASGHPLNPTGHKLFDAATGRMAWSGSSYLLAYTLANGHSFAQPLDDDGNLTGTPKDLAIGGPAVAMVSNGENILLVHTFTDAGVDVSLLDRDGTIRTTTLIAPSYRFSLPFALPDGDYAFTTLRGVTLSLVTIGRIDGHVTEKALFDISQSAQASAMASSDGQILIAVQRDAESGVRTVSYEVIRRDGTVVAPTTLLESAPTRSFSGRATPAVGWDGSQFLVGVQWWNSDDDRTPALHAFRIAADGTRIDSAPLVLDPGPVYVGAPTLFASSAAGQLMAWDSNSDVFVRAATSFNDIATAPAQDITLAPALQRFPKLAPGPIAVWVEDDINPSVHASAIGGTDSGILKESANIVTPPAVARGQFSYLVVWRFWEPLRILGRRVAFDGTPLGDPFVIATDPNAYPNWPYDREDLSASFDGRTFFLVSWVGANNEVHAARVAEAGAVMDAQPLVISNAYANYENAITPRIVATSSGFVVAWLQLHYCGCLFSPPPPPTSRLLVARVTDDGVVTQLGSTWSGGATDQLVLTPIANKQMVAIWRDTNDTPNQWCVNRVVLNENGTPAGSVAPLKCEVPNILADLDAAWDGTKLTLVWRDQGTEMIFVQHFDPVVPATLDGPLQVNPSGTRAIAPSVVANVSGVTIAYQRLADVSRVFARVLGANVAPRRRPTR